MKKYNKPEIEFASFSAEDIITTSAVANGPKVTMMTADGLTVDAIGLGEQNFSIFDTVE